MARLTSGGPARDAQDGPARAIRQAIVTITSARETALRNAATALVNQAQVRHALAVQQAGLSAARAEVDAAIAAAQRVAESVRRDDGEEAAAPYLRHVEGLRSQLQVIDLATAQLGELSEVSGEHVSRARSVLDTSRRSLDAALREQLRLLVAVERLDRARAVAAVRAQAAARAGAGHARTAGVRPPIAASQRVDEADG